MRDRLALRQFRVGTLMDSSRRSRDPSGKTARGPVPPPLAGRLWAVSGHSARSSPGSQTPQRLVRLLRLVYNSESCRYRRHDRGMRSERESCRG